jgi:sugar phosphate isomerase/epimerase
MSQPNSSRRDFMRTAAALSMGAKAGPSLWGAVPRIEFPTEPRNRLAVTSWPFRALIEAPGNRARDARQSGMDLKEFPAMVAARFDVHNINPLAAHFRSSDAAYVEEFRAAVEKAGSRLVDLGLSGRCFFHPDRARREEALAYGRQWIDIAVSLGCPSVRQHLSGLPGVKADVALTAETLGKLAAYSANKGVVINLENDDPASEDPFFLVAVIEKVGTPYVRGLPDFANSMRPDGDAERNYAGVDAMFKHVFNMCHVKDAMTGGGAKIYTVNLDRLFAIAKRHDYRGYYSIEVDVAGDPFAITRRLVQETLKRLALG